MIPLPSKGWILGASAAALLFSGFVAGAKVATWRAGAKLARLEARVELLVDRRQEDRETIRRTNAAVAVAEALTAEVQSRLDAESEKPPREVTVYRDRVRTVEKVIRSEDCTEALVESLELLPDPRNGGPP